MTDEHIIPEGINNPGVLINNFEAVKRLQEAIISAPRDINIMRQALARIIQDNAWRQRLDPFTGQVYQCDTFQQFIAEKMPRGLETDAATIRSFLADSPEAIVFEQVLALNTERGGNHNPEGTNQHKAEVVKDNNIIIDHHPPKPRTSPTGTSKAQAVRKLTREADAGNVQAASLLTEVKAGEKSPHRAMVEAGFRKEQTPRQIAERAALKMSPEERADFLTWLSDLCREDASKQGT
jgi:hypothetical protein